MANNSLQGVSKIRLIEEPLSEELLLSELESVLGGWNCMVYKDGTCNRFSTGDCVSLSGKNFCYEYDMKSIPPPDVTDKG